MKRYDYSAEVGSPKLRELKTGRFVFYAAAQAEIDELVDMLEWTTVNDEVRQFQRSAEILALIKKHKDK
jgi:hypothetical protein